MKINVRLATHFIETMLTSCGVKLSHFREPIKFLCL
jgi:hypothetical protein